MSESGPISEYTEEEYRKLLNSLGIGPFPETINILGTEYTISFEPAKTKDFVEQDAIGFCNTINKHIRIAYNEDMDCLIDRPAAENREYFASTLRHELMHAFLHESGLAAETNFAEDEVLVDWLALQLPKIAATLDNADLLQMKRGKANGKKND